jgi:hypothetical protein
VVKDRDGLFGICWFRSAGGRQKKNRPIDSDSCRRRAKFEPRDFPFEIKIENFDGSIVGCWPSGERFCAYKSGRYDVLRESSGSDRGSTAEYIGMEQRVGGDVVPQTQTVRISPEKSGY